MQGLELHFDPMDLTGEKAARLIPALPGASLPLPSANDRTMLVLEIHRRYARAQDVLEEGSWDRSELRTAAGILANSANYSFRLFGLAHTDDRIEYLYQEIWRWANAGYAGAEVMQATHGWPKDLLQNSTYDPASLLVLMIAELEHGAAGLELEAVPDAEFQERATIELARATIAGDKMPRWHRLARARFTKLHQPIHEAAAG